MVQTGALRQEAIVSEAEDIWKDAFDKLDCLRKLGNNWDGLGGEGPSDELIDSVVGLVNWVRRQGELPPPSSITPSPGGTIVVEWEKQDGTYLEAEVVWPFFAEVMLQQPGQPTKYWKIPTE